MSGSGTPKVVCAKGSRSVVSIRVLATVLAGFFGWRFLWQGCCFVRCSLLFWVVAAEASACFWCSCYAQVVRCCVPNRLCAAAAVLWLLPCRIFFLFGCVAGVALHLFPCSFLFMELGY